MKVFDIHVIMATLRHEKQSWRTPAVTILAGGERSPFAVLVACIISLRTRDEVTAVAAGRLLKRAGSPECMCRLSDDEIAFLIYPAGFYRNKASQLRAIAERLVTDYAGLVPDDMEKLLTFKGVGRKTANLVLTLGFGKPGICVDTHVHRICNRWGYVETSTPQATEMALRAKLPVEYWIEINDLLVAFGQNQCHPVSPRCSVCRLGDVCAKAGVSKSR